MSGTTDVNDRKLQENTEICYSHQKVSRKHTLVYVAVLLIGILVISLSVLYIKPMALYHPEYDKGVESGMPSLDKDKFGYSILEVADDYKIQICGLPANDGQNIDLYLTNLKTNNVWFRAEIYDANANLLGSSGVIKQGKYVKTVTLDEPLKERETPVSVKIIGYEPGSWVSKGSVSLKLTIYKDYK